MQTKLANVLRRARYAAIGAAVGAGLGALVSRNAASTGGALGALAGATAAEKRVAAGERIEDIKEDRLETVKE